MSGLAKFFGLCLAALLMTIMAAQAQDYRIKRGDTLQVEVLEDPSLNRAVLVTPDGRISVPLAGTIQAAGRTVSQVSRNLATKLAPNFASAPTVFVGVQALAAPRQTGPVEPPRIEIYVVGESNKPGKLSVEPGTTLLQMFAEMGGFTKFAATKRIQLRRASHKHGQEMVYTFSYPDIVAGASSGGSTRLRDGDVILIPQRRLFE